MWYRIMLWLVVTVLAVESLVMSIVWTLGVGLILAVAGILSESKQA